MKNEKMRAKKRDYSSESLAVCGSSSLSYTPAVSEFCLFGSEHGTWESDGATHIMYNACNIP